ncbi:MAG: HAD family hydrolase [Spirochaetota bacterium]
MVIFDVDHTITSKSTGRRFAECAQKSGYFPWYRLLVVPIFYIRYRYGALASDELMKYLLPLQGMSREALMDLTTTCFHARIKPDIYRDAVEEVARHREAGRHVVLATSSLDIIIEPLAEFLGIEDVICTRVEFNDGIATGHSANPPCFGQEKERQVLEFIRARGGDPGECTFYSDSSHDLPLLRAIGTPVAVNADRRLRRIADRDGWQLLTFRR